MSYKLLIPLIILLIFILPEILYFLMPAMGRKSEERGADRIKEIERNKLSTIPIVYKWNGWIILFLSIALLLPMVPLLTGLSIMITHELPVESLSMFFWICTVPIIFMGLAIKILVEYFQGPPVILSPDGVLKGKKLICWADIENVGFFSYGFRSSVITYDLNKEKYRYFYNRRMSINGLMIRDSAGLFAYSKKFIEKAKSEVNK